MNKTFNAAQKVVRPNEDGRQTISYRKRQRPKETEVCPKKCIEFYQVFEINKEYVECNTVMYRMAIAFLEPIPDV